MTLPGDQIFSQQKYLKKNTGKLSVEFYQIIIIFWFPKNEGQEGPQ